MQITSTSSPNRLDELRAKQPDLGFALYAIEPHGLVTLEVFTPDGEMFSFKDVSAEGAMNQAFPPVPEPVSATAVALDLYIDEGKAWKQPAAESTGSIFD